MPLSYEKNDLPQNLIFNHKLNRTNAPKKYMKYWWKVQMYETQTILYWILGVLLLQWSGHWLGWVAIWYGVFAFVHTIKFVAKNAKELKDLF